MKILIVTPIFPPEIGGPATYVWELVKRLKTKHEVTVICFSNHLKKIPGIKIIPLRLSSNTLTRQLNLFLISLFYSIKSNRVYIQGPLVVGLVSSTASKLSNTQSILKFVGDEVWEQASLSNSNISSLENFYLNPLTFSHRFKKALQNISFLFVGQVITPSNYLKKFLTKNYHLDPKKVQVVPNAVEISVKRLKKKPHQLIFVGRLVPWKNIDQIIKAVKVARHKKPWKLLVVGEGPELVKLKRLTKRLKAGSWVKFTGRLSKDQALKEIAKSQKLILYSDYEGLSHTVIEAMLLGTQIVASQIKANSEVTGGHAKLVSPNDSLKLAAAINQPSKDTAAAKKFAKGRYTWNIHLKSLTKLL